MVSISDAYGVDQHLLKYSEIVRDSFDEPVGAELGVAYGGCIEKIGKLWSLKRGTIYGFDTFEGHPTHISYSKSATESYCMDDEYARYGHRERLSYEYQRAELDRQGLGNVILVKGLINEKSFDNIPELHFAYLDLDLINSMVLGWTLVRPRMVSGGYLCMHDVVPLGNMTGLWGLYQEILAYGEYELVKEIPSSLLVILRRK